MGEIKYFSMFTGIGGFEVGLGLCTDAILKQTISKTKEIVKSEQLTLDEDVQPLDTYKELEGFDGFKCVGVCEFDKTASMVLRYRFPDTPNHGDATKIDPVQLPDFDMLVGGFPCQNFSLAGKRKGFEEARGTLFFEMARVIKEKKPAMCLFENVTGLLSHDNGKSIEVILEVLSDLGYAVDFDVMNTKYFGVPQNRERVFIVAKRLDLLTADEIV